MLEAIQGHKTYFIAAFIALVVVGHYLGYIDDNAYTLLLGLLGAGGTASIAAKINRNTGAVIIFGLLFLGFGGVAQAQAANTLQWDYNAPLSEVQTYTQSVVVNGTTLTTPPNCVSAGTNLTTCNVVATFLSAGNNITISATKGSVTAATVITGLTTANSPKNGVNIKAVITVTVTLP